MTSRMGSFAAGVTPLLPLSSYCVYKNRQASVSQAKRGAWGPANVRTWQIWTVWETANHLPQNHRDTPFFASVSFLWVNSRRVQVTILPRVHRAWPAAVWVARSRTSCVFSSTPLCRRAGICVAEAFPSRAPSSGRLPSHLGWEAPGQGRTDLARLALFLSHCTHRGL